MQLEQIRRLTISGAGDRPGQSQILELQRSWPLDANHLLLEYRNEAGMILAGQWNRDPGELKRLGAAMAGGSGQHPLMVHNQGQSVLLQPRGLDGRLRGLRTLLRSQHSELLSHRPGKRAIVRWLAVNPPQYCKLFASKRAFVRAVQNFDHARGSAEGFGAPAIQRRLKHSKALVLSAVVGTSLHQRLRDGGINCNHAQQIGVALRALQAMPGAPHLHSHSAVDEAKLLTDWMQRIASFLPPWSARMEAHCEAITAQLSRCVTPKMVVSHRDLHDKQILIAPNHPPGFIDFDTLAMADPALDPANLLAHLELRQLQGLCSEDSRLATADALLQGVEPSRVPEHLQAYLDAARLRLACVYGFRPRWQGVMDPMLTRIGRPWDVGLRGVADQ